MRLVYDGPKAPLFKAMADARRHFKHLATSGKVQFGEGNKARKHEYAPLDVVIDALEPGLDALGMCVMQPHDGFSLWTIVAVGESSLTVEQPLPEWKSAQDLGSLLTYFRRYHLKGIFCVADGEDDDGVSAPGGQGTLLPRKEPTVTPKAGKLSPELSAQVVAKAKELELGRDEFSEMVRKHTGKLWKECEDSDAQKLLTVLGAKEAFGKDGAK